MNSYSVSAKRRYIQEKVESEQPSEGLPLTEDYLAPGMSRDGGKQTQEQVEYEHGNVDRVDGKVPFECVDIHCNGRKQQQQDRDNNFESIDVFFTAAIFEYPVQKSAQNGQYGSGQTRYAQVVAGPLEMDVAGKVVEDQKHGSEN